MEGEGSRRSAALVSHESSHIQELEPKGYGKVSPRRTGRQICKVSPARALRLPPFQQQTIGVDSSATTSTIRPSTVPRLPVIAPAMCPASNSSRSRTSITAAPEVARVRAAAGETSVLRFLASAAGRRHPSPNNSGNLTARAAKTAKTRQPSSREESVRIEIFPTVHPSLSAAEV